MKPELAVSTEKKHTAWELWVQCHSGQSEGSELLESLTHSLSGSSGNRSEEGGGRRYVCASSDGGYMQSSTRFGRRWLPSRGADVTLHDFSAFLGMRRCKNWARKVFSWKYLTLWRPLLPVFPEHRGPPSWSPAWTPFRMCWRSATAVTSDLILVEAGGQWQFLVGSRNTRETDKSAVILGFHYHIWVHATPTPKVLAKWNVNKSWKY